MLNIFADALLIATRQLPMPRAAQPGRPAPVAPKRPWFSLSRALR